MDAQREERQELHRLVDALPADQVSVALTQLRARNQSPARGVMAAGLVRCSDGIVAGRIRAGG